MRSFQQGFKNVEQSEMASFEPHGMLFGSGTLIISKKLKE